MIPKQFFVNIIGLNISLQTLKISIISITFY